MANGLANLIPDAYAALNVVSRELVGFIPSVTRDVRLERAAVGQVVRSHVVPKATSANIVPGQLPPNSGGQTVGNIPITISKAKAVGFDWQGEEQRGLDNGGAGVLTIQQDQIAEAIRALTNEIEADVAALQAKASRAYGTPGSALFATSGDYTDASNLLKVLLDNGCPNSDLQMVINTTAGSNLRGKQGGKANEAGTAEILRRGVLLDIHGFAIRESAAVQVPAVGTASGATTNAAGYAVGATVLTLASAGTGTLLAGDIVMFAGDSNKYLIASGDADVSNGGTITLALPGLLIAMSAATKAITVVAQAARNMGFRRSAMILGQRLPALPKEGDSAVDRTTITDPISGLSFELAMYKQYRQVHYEVACAWGQEMIKAEHAALLIGL